jgi:hypothetical protein
MTAAHLVRFSCCSSPHNHSLQAQSTPFSILRTPVIQSKESTHHTAKQDNTVWLRTFPLVDIDEPQTYMSPYKSKTPMTSSVQLMTIFRTSLILTRLTRLKQNQMPPLMLDRVLENFNQTIRPKARSTDKLYQRIE